MKKNCDIKGLLPFFKNTKNSYYTYKFTLMIPIYTCPTIYIISRKAKGGN